MPLRYRPDALQGIPKQHIERIRNKIDWLWENRDIVSHFPLSRNLAGFRKRRVGDYRIVYTFDADLDDMVIHLAGLRDTIYDSIT